MFKKRSVKTASGAKRRVAEEENDDDVGTDFGQVSKKVKTVAKVSRDVDYSKRESHGVSQENPPDEVQKLEEPEREEQKIKASGPKAAPKNVRVTTLTDFQPDVCKDFQQTGYCGYGDTCKFLHIRDESKQKKPIDKEWETVASTENHINVSVSGVPFKCPMCKKDYENPVKTGCDHVFCQKCFMDRFKKEKKRKCFICKKDTGGVVIPVKNI